jgi:hypothetical protein
MKTNKSRITAVLLAFSLSIAQAAEPVKWDDLSMKVWGRHKDREYRVVTKDGTVHKGYELAFNSAGVRVSPSEPPIPREQLKEIRIHRTRRLADALMAPGDRVFGPLCGGGEFGCFLLWVFAPIAIPVGVGMDVAAAPIILPIEGIRRLLPDKVIKVAP